MWGNENDSDDLKGLSPTYRERREDREDRLRSTDHCEMELEDRSSVWSKEAEFGLCIASSFIPLLDMYRFRKQGREAINGITLLK